MDCFYLIQYSNRYDILIVRYDFYCGIIDTIGRRLCFAVPYCRGVCSGRNDCCEINDMLNFNSSVEIAINFYLI